MDFLDKLQFVGWGVALAIVGFLVRAIVGSRNKAEK